MSRAEPSEWASSVEMMSRVDHVRQGREDPWLGGGWPFVAMSV